MQAGYSLNSYWSGPNSITIKDCPDPTSSDGYWHPVNAEGAGTYSLALATAHSVNTIFAQVIAQLGPEKVVDMAHALGIRSALRDVCSITLGSVAVNPLEMTNAYATLANQGTRYWATPFVEVKTPGGKVDPTIAEQGQEVIKSNDADLVTYALEGVVRGGTGTSAAIPGFVVAGKTGTANENVDAWFCGYTVQIVTCVWMGWPQGEIPLQDIEGVPSVFGGTIPAAIWHDFMSVAMEGQTPETFATPSFSGYTIGPETPVPVTPSPSPSPSPSEEPTPTPKPSKSVTPSATPSESTSPSPSPSALPS